MFEGGAFKFPSSLKSDCYDTDAELYRFIQQLTRIRAMTPALIDGTYVIRYAAADAAGPLVFSRVRGDREVIVALNTSLEPCTARIKVDPTAPHAAAPLVDLLDEGYSVGDGSGPGHLAIALPSHGVRVLVPDCKMTCL